MLANTNRANRPKVQADVSGAKIEEKKNFVEKIVNKLSTKPKKKLSKKKVK